MIKKIRKVLLTYFFQRVGMACIHLEIGQLRVVSAQRSELQGVASDSAGSCISNE